MKYGKDIINKICDLISSDDYTIPEICEQAGIHESTYHEWRNTKPDFSEAIKKADEKRLETFKKEARNSALKKIKGYTFEETKTVMIGGDSGTPVIKEKTITKKHIPPDTTMLIFTLKNTDAENFKDRQEVDHNHKRPLKIEITPDQKAKLDDLMNDID